jgi:hypothetical protein
VTVTSVPLVPVTRSVNVPRAVEAVVRTRSVVLPGVAIGLLDQLAVAPNPFTAATDTVLELPPPGETLADEGATLTGNPAPRRATGRTTARRVDHSRIRCRHPAGRLSQRLSHNRSASAVPCPLR